MKKNFLTRVITMTMAAVMALTPVTASAAEKKVVTSKEYHAARVSFYDEETEESDNKGYYNYIKSLDGCYQENGNKIYTILNGSKKTFKKTGSYSIIVGGKTAKKDEGTFKFVAPKTGTYKFTFTTKDNVAGEQIFLSQDGNTKEGCFFKVNYKVGSRKLTKDTSVLVTDNAKHTAIASKGSNVFSDWSNDKSSKMTKVSGSVKMKKGQWISFTGRSSHARYDEDEAYNFTGFDVTITKTK